MLQSQNLTTAWRDAFQKINEDIFGFQAIKPDVDKWIEENIFIPLSTSVKPGPYSFDFTPYMRRPCQLIHPNNPARFITIMKDGQSGFTTALVIGGMLYIIAISPDGILFTAADINLSAKTIEERFDPVVRGSKLEHLIRPNVIKKTNNRTGDTSKKKEYAGGTMTIAGTNSANTFRMFSAKYIFADDYDTAPKEIGKEGSPKMVMKTRQNSFGDKAKTFMISTPTVTQTSNVWEQFQLGTQEHWNWPCPGCGEFFPVTWQVQMADGTLAGIVWQVDENKKLIRESVRYRCQHCGHLIEENQKYDLNMLGQWIATVTDPVERNHISLQKNFIYNPPGFDGWVTGVEEWLAACPPGEKVDVVKLKTFNNLRLGLPFADFGESPRVNELMQNTRDYHPGIIPDLTCKNDGNGKIILLTLSCDLNGIMKEGIEDVRLDWELLAHSSSGPTYSVDHGSIGTFKRSRDRSKLEADKEADRIKWTLVHGSVAFDENNQKVNNSVWGPFEDIIKKAWPLESAQSQVSPLTSGGDLEGAFSDMLVNITVVDTGFGEKLAMQFIQNMQEQHLFVYGVKGRVEENYRKLQRDSNPVTRSREKPRMLYIVEVNQMKDDLSQLIKLRQGEDGSQPGGFMNYPDPRDGKYNMKNYFSHYEGEQRKEVMGKNNDVIGYQWVKKNSQVQNHFWDVRIYNLAATLIFIDILKQTEPRFSKITWEEYVMMMS